MLEMLDVLIGFTTVMLVMSMAVTMVTQLIGSQISNLRGRALKTGTARLLALLDRGLTPGEADRIANHILRNPLVGPPPGMFLKMVLAKRNRLASTIHREELIKLILDFAADGDAERANDHETADEAGLRDKLRRSVAANGIEDPAGLLKQIRNSVVELERTSPELSHSMRLNMAILAHGASDFLSKLNSWFDQTIDRVSEVFTGQIRAVSAGVALVLAFVLHLDAIALLNRLSVDDDLRDQLVAAALQRVEGTEAGRLPQPSAPTPPGVESRGETSVHEDLEAIREAGLADLEEFGLVSFPRSWGEWLDRWHIEQPEKAGSDLPKEERLDSRQKESLGQRVKHSLALLFGILLSTQMLGILLSAALLSLGAPFWYSALRDLVKLRSVIARKDDAERAERQTTQPPVLDPPPPQGSGR